MSNAYRTGKTLQIAVRVPHDVMADLDRFQQDTGRTTTEAVVWLMRFGLASRAPAPANTPAHEQGTDAADTIRNLINRKTSP